MSDIVAGAYFDQLIDTLNSYLFMLVIADDVKNDMLATLLNMPVVLLAHLSGSRR